MSFDKEEWLKAIALRPELSANAKRLARELAELADDEGHVWVPDQPEPEIRLGWPS